MLTGAHSIESLAFWLQGSDHLPRNGQPGTPSFCKISGLQPFISHTFSASYSFSGPPACFSGACGVDTQLGCGAVRDPSRFCLAPSPTLAHTHIFSGAFCAQTQLVSAALGAPDMFQCLQCPAPVISGACGASSHLFSAPTLVFWRLRRQLAFLLSVTLEFCSAVGALPGCA